VIVALVALSGLIVRRRITPRFASLAAVLAVFWVLTAMVRAEVGPPSSSRYIYPGAVLLVLLLVEAWGGLGWTRFGVRAWRIAAALVACGAAVAVASSVQHLQNVGNGARRLFAHTNAELARLSCEPKPVPPAYAPDPMFVPFVVAAPYRAAIRDLGSPVPSAVLRGVCGGSG
jgi:hypothetical protein